MNGIAGRRRDEVFRIDAMPTARPYDARALIENTGRSLQIYVPKRGFHAAGVVMLGFATFWTVFTAFWTLAASGVLFDAGEPRAMNFAFAAFSIPFWVIGVVMLGGAIWSMGGTVNLRIDPDRMIVERRCLLVHRMRVIPRRHIQHAEMRQKTWQSEGANSNQTLAIVHAGGIVKLPLDEPTEMAWLRDEINAFLQAEPTG
jgi:hypothetical protein